MADIYEKIKFSRDKNRPTALEYVENVFDEFYELHGDGKTGDDKAVIGGIAVLNGIPVTVIGTEKGRTIEERIEKNFGLPTASGYGKALRLMKQAEKFGRPVITFVDTQGADCKEDAEKSGIAKAISEILSETLKLAVPIIAVLIGEGGSGGALALAAADKVFMSENAYYSVITPEACAEILYKDVKKAAIAAEMLKPVAEELIKINVIDGIIKEPSDFSDTEQKREYFSRVKNMLIDEIRHLNQAKNQSFIDKRYNRFRAF